LSKIISNFGEILIDINPNLPNNKKSSD
jgi:hypothetical protein